jgi:hypothetical protein
MPARDFAPTIPTWPLACGQKHHVLATFPCQRSSNMFWCPDHVITCAVCGFRWLRVQVPCQDPLRYARIVSLCGGTRWPSQVMSKSGNRQSDPEASAPPTRQRPMRIGHISGRRDSVGASGEDRAVGGVAGEQQGRSGASEPRASTRACVGIIRVRTPG